MHGVVIGEDIRPVPQLRLDVAKFLDNRGWTSIDMFSVRVSLTVARDNVAALKKFPFWLPTLGIGTLRYPVAQALALQK